MLVYPSDTPHTALDRPRRSACATSHFIVPSQLLISLFHLAMLDYTTIFIILFFIVSSVFGHFLLHRIIKTPAQYYRPSQSSGWIEATVR